MELFSFQIHFNRTDLDNILSSSEYDPNNLIDLLKRDFRKELEADAGVWEHYTVGSHTLMVMRQFEKYFSKERFPTSFGMGSFRFILAMHDIGVCAAIEEGAKVGIGVRDAKRVGQHRHTLIIVETVMCQLNFNKNEIDIAKALLSNDPIGSYIKNGNPTRDIVIKMATESGISVRDIFDLLLILYMVDAGSYTEDAGGENSLDHLFVFNRDEMKMTFSSEIQCKINSLTKSLGG